MSFASRSSTLAIAAFGLALCAHLPAAAQSGATQPAPAPAASTPASAATLALTQGKVITDPAGAFITVQVKNNGTQPVDRIVVGCEFFAGKKSLGSSSTTLFGTVAGVTGSDQVRLIGGTSAKTATCAITMPAS